MGNKIIGRAIVQLAAGTATLCAQALVSKMEKPGSIFGKHGKENTLQSQTDTNNNSGNIEWIKSWVVDNKELIVVCIFVVGLAIGLTYVYTRCRGGKKGGGKKGGDLPIIDQSASDKLVDAIAVLDNNQPPELPEFKPIKMTKEQFNNIRSLTQDDFSQCVNNIKCQYTNYVMRQPYRMTCCMKETSNVGEKNQIQKELGKSKRCIFCKSQADKSFMKFDNRIYNEIQGLRPRLVKVYKQANAVQKRKWKGFIDNQFGPGYTQKHLEKFEFSE